VLGGESLRIYEYGSDADDPVADVMLDAKLAVGRFGGALRRLLAEVADLNPDTVRRAQCLTEQATQRVLSVKAGERPMRFSDYDLLVQAILMEKKVDPNREDWIKEILDERGWRKVDARAILERTRPFLKAFPDGFWQEIAVPFKRPAPEGVAWLFKPWELAKLTRNGKTLTLPVSDVRVQALVHRDLSVNEGNSLD
jgi:hypothetical protein